MNTAAAHIPALASITGAAVIALILGWYWARLGAADVPESRRRLRRASMLVMFVAIAVLVYAASFADGDLDPQGYTVTWAMALTLLLLIVFLAFLDVLNNLRIHRRDRARSAIDARYRLRQAMIDQRGTVEANANGESKP
jgi:uncharacterized membrane protein SpoIIM required for sporulation